MNAVRVNRDSDGGFPYKGYGFAWTQEFTGSCGEEIVATLKVTAVYREKRWGFPYFGFGFAWPSKGVLRLTIAD